jgi:hypothetical protein
VNTLPRPLDRVHAQSHEPHFAQVWRGTCRQAPHFVQRWKRSSPLLQCA